MRLAIPLALLLSLPAVAGAQAPTSPPAAHRMPAASATDLPSGVAWGPAPAVFPAGAQIAVLNGDPSGAGMFTVRLRFPDGYRIPPHVHPTDELVTVIGGVLAVGMGEQRAEAGMMLLPAGGFVVAPANHAHYVTAHGLTVVQVNAMGPFALTYSNPADTPAAARPAR